MVFDDIDGLRKHRFESHAVRRPQLFIDDREVGTQTLRIARKLNAAQIRVVGADHVVLDGTGMTAGKLPSLLARSSGGSHNIVLKNGDIEARFEIDVRVASQEDVEGVERQLHLLASKRQLDGRSVEEFIDTAREFRTAIGYCDGIAHYLYGVLAKEQAKDITTPFEKYTHKFNLAANCLGAYDRRIARMLSALIAFHFNHFRESNSLLPDSRVGLGALRFAEWIDGNESAVWTRQALHDTRFDESTLTELDTETILGWVSRPVNNLAGDILEMEKLLARGHGYSTHSDGSAPLATLDEPKLHVLLGEVHISQGQRMKAIHHAKAVRNQPYFDRWASRVLESQ